MAERFKSPILDTSPFVRKRSNPIFDKQFFLFFYFYFLVYFFSAYKSINDCFNIREIVVFIRSREGYNWAIALGTPRVIAQF